MIIIMNLLSFTDLAIFVSYFMFNLKIKKEAWHAVQNSSINCINTETPQVENNYNNDYKRFKSQEA